MLIYCCLEKEFSIIKDNASPATLPANDLDGYRVVLDLLKYYEFAQVCAKVVNFIEIKIQ